MQGRDLCVFREDYSTDRTTLMSIREGDVTVENALEIITRFITFIIINGLARCQANSQC